MDGGGHLAGCAGHAPVGDQRDLEPAILHHAQRWGQLMQFGHAVRLWPLEADDDDHVAFQFTRLEGAQHVVLRVEDGGRGFDRPERRIDRADLHHAAAEIARQQAHAAIRAERIGHGPQHIFVARYGHVAPLQRFILQHWLLAIVGQVAARDGQDIAVEQAIVEQFADDEAHAASRMKMVHIARSIGIDPRQQRHDVGYFRKIGPIDADASGPRDRGQVDRMIGRATGRHQADDGVDDRLFIDAMAERAIILAVPPDAGEPMRGRTGQFAAQLRARIDEGGAGHVQPHHFHHHLVGVGRAIESAGARAMIAGAFGLQQFVAADFSFGIQLTDADLFLVGEAGWHRPGGNEDGGQMAKAQRPHQQPRHDLVADTEQRDALEHRMAERHGGRQRDGVAAEQRQFHA